MHVWAYVGTRAHMWEQVLVEARRSRWMSLWLELQEVMGCPVGIQRTELRSSSRAVNALKHRALSPALWLTILKVLIYGRECVVEQNTSPHGAQEAERTLSLVGFLFQFRVQVYWMVFPKFGAYLLPTPLVNPLWKRPSRHSQNVLCSPLRCILVLASWLCRLTITNVKRKSLVFESNMSLWSWART